MLTSVLRFFRSVSTRNGTKSFIARRSTRTIEARAHASPWASCAMACLQLALVATPAHATLGEALHLGDIEATGGGSSRRALQTAEVPFYWPRVANRHCHTANDGMIASYSTVEEAVAACDADGACLYIYDHGCDGVGVWKTCSTDGVWTLSSTWGGCLYEKADEPVCDAFSTTYPSTPAGYIVPNPHATTVNGLGTLACASDFVEIMPLAITCDGSTFSEIAGLCCASANVLAPGLCCESGDTLSPSNGCCAPGSTHLTRGCGFHMTNELLFAAVEECKIESGSSACAT